MIKKIEKYYYQKTLSIIVRYLTFLIRNYTQKDQVVHFVNMEQKVIAI